MRTSIFLILHILLAATAMADERSATDARQLAQLEQQAQTLVRQFVGELKPQLKQALQEGGPASAIEVCADIAPQLADKLSASSGWQVKRVSLKPRNAGRAQPDAWEKTVLQAFNRRQAAGEPAANINQEAFGNGQYRYMQAQGTQALCLTCHGTNLAPQVQAELQTYYPNDEATGYTLGQVRGAISLTNNCVPGACENSETNQTNGDGGNIY